MSLLQLKLNRQVKPHPDWISRLHTRLEQLPFLCNGIHGLQGSFGAASTDLSGGQHCADGAVNLDGELDDDGALDAILPRQGRVLYAGLDEAKQLAVGAKLTVCLRQVKTFFSEEGHVFCESAVFRNFINWWWRWRRWRWRGRRCNDRWRSRGNHGVTLVDEITDEGFGFYLYVIRDGLNNGWRRWRWRWRRRFGNWDVYVNNIIDNSDVAVDHLFGFELRPVDGDEAGRDGHTKRQTVDGAGEAEGIVFESFAGGVEGAAAQQAAQQQN